MEIVGKLCVLRPLRVDDDVSIASLGNNRNIWLNVTNHFPHPYTIEDARAFIARRLETPGPPRTLAITLQDTAVGVIDVDLKSDVYCRTAVAGYWLGEPYWGRGIVTEALRLITNYAFQTFEIDRIEASVFAWNAASARVLEKAGYTLEGRHRKASFKDGKVTDDLVYAVVR
ncbi:MAG: GNAT family N-acetyltransferase [Candidatus Hydrogenedentes bacterium]|nr:GNAT family N-acetyltransferase [Candidatus Hydrogenedentota bacterium]